MLGCVLVAVLIDQYVLETIVEMISPEWLPLGFFEVILLPFILYLAAKFAGPTKAIKVTYRRTPKPKDQS